MYVIGTDLLGVEDEWGVPRGRQHAVDDAGRSACSSSRARYTWPALRWADADPDREICAICLEVLTAPDESPTHAVLEVLTAPDESPTHAVSQVAVVDSGELDVDTVPVPSPAREWRHDDARQSW